MICHACSEKRNKVAMRERERERRVCLQNSPHEFFEWCDRSPLNNDAYINPPTKRISMLAIPTIWRIGCGREFWVFDFGRLVSSQHSCHSLRLLVTTSRSGISDVMIKQKTNIGEECHPIWNLIFIWRYRLYLLAYRTKKRNSKQCCHSCHGYHCFIVTT